MERDDYIALAKEALVELVGAEYAFVGLEAMAKISDQLWPSLPTRVDPDLVALARTELLDQGYLSEDRTKTRGGRILTTYRQSDVSRRKTLTEAAAARKRLLLARYLGWAHGTPGEPSIIGPAAESVLRNSLRAAHAPGLLLVNNADQATHFVGQSVPGGPLDSLCHLLVMQAMNPVTVDIPIEVKNIRGWIYPWSKELYQLLSKTSHLQRNNPDRRILPVLVCRRMHYMTGRMAKELGFYGIELGYQPISEAVDDQFLQEVRNELGFLDLTGDTSPSELIIRRFELSLPKDAADRADRWASYGPLLSDVFDVLRADLDDRRAPMSAMYERVRGAPWWNADWPAAPR